ncbi:MAG: RNA polymerase sigma-70 factor [Dysgonamonadaceae bacterium]|jgi:RNA polymerase sigma-70 factor (ECF subfamily)|nr:RNA polymerase sigma-70 factor [Dysgonamonadaceae bacterium]
MDYYAEHIDLERLALGDTKVFRQFFLEYYPKVKAFIVYFVKSEAVAEDLSQDIFEHIWRHKDFLTNLKSLNAYVFRMAKNFSINYLNHKIIEEKHCESYAPLEEYSIEEELYVKELELLIQLTVEKMPKQRRLIFEMSRIKNLKNAEIAEKLNISKSTVENHLNLALKQIREVTSLSILFFCKKNQFSIGCKGRFNCLS